MSALTAPDGYYLVTRYEDLRRGERRERWYADDGSVWLEVDGTRSLWCSFDPEQVVAARRAVTESGITGLADVHVEDGHDLAVMSYAWRLDGRTGRVVDTAYPAVVPPEMDRLEELLADLEQAAGG